MIQDTRVKTVTSLIRKVACASLFVESTLSVLVVVRISVTPICREAENNEVKFATLLYIRVANKLRIWVKFNALVSDMA